MIERLLGGPAETRPVERDLTDVELALTRRIFTTMVAQLSLTWTDLLGPGSTLQRDRDPAGEHPARRRRASRRSRSRSSCSSAGSSSTITLLVPHRSIEPLLGNLSKGPYGDAYEPVPAEDAELRVSAALRGVPVEVRAEVGSRDLSVDEVLALKPGDVLRLGPSSRRRGAVRRGGADAPHPPRPERPPSRRLGH